MAEIGTILHPTDLSEASDAARQLACAIARDYGAHLILLHAYPPPLTGAEAVDRERSDGISEDLMAKLQDLVVDDWTVAVEYWVVEGRPAEMILRAAADQKCDLIVMGTHGRSGLRRAVMGSVAEAVCRGAGCPVATVRPTIAIPREETARRGGDVNPVGVCVDDPSFDLGAGD